MAIFPEYAMPKYKSPIRITKPYQKPNYLADAIIGGMGAYTNMQGMNLKKQMFMAQMAQQQKAIADKQAKDQMEADIYTQQRTGPGRTGVGIQGYLGDAGPNFTQPMGISAVDQRVAAALAGGANPMRALSVADSLYPRASGNNFNQNLALTKWKDKLQQREVGVLEEAGNIAGRMIGDTFGVPLGPEFQFEEDWAFDPTKGPESTQRFIENAEWRGETGPKAYRNMVIELKKIATKMILDKNIDKSDIMTALQEMYVAGSSWSWLEAT